MRNKIKPNIGNNSDNSTLDFPKTYGKTHQISKPLRIKIKPSIYESSIVDNKPNIINNKKQKKHVIKKLDKHHKFVQNSDYDDSTIRSLSHAEELETLPNISITFSNILSTNDNIECAVMKFRNFIHIWSSTKMENVIIKDTEGKIKIKDFKDFNDKITSGDITIFNTETGTLYSGIICVENNKLRFKITNRPIIPLCTIMKGVILQFNIYIN